MAQEPVDADIAMDGANLYQEETFTDRRIGTLMRLTPVTASGARDEAREVLFVGQTQVLTPAGVYQFVEAYLQLIGKAGDNQVRDAGLGLVQNMGGTGATVVTHVLQRTD